MIKCEFVSFIILELVLSLCLDYWAILVELVEFEKQDKYLVVKAIAAIWSAMISIFFCNDLIYRICLLFIFEIDTQLLNMPF